MNSVDWIELSCKIIGGLGLFLYGMKMMSEGLQKTAGDQLRNILEKLTSNRIMGVIVGIVVTSIIQSSSATTVMVVGFVNAGLMNLAQSLGVVLGANVGTTVTAQLIAFKIGAFALPAIGLGVLFRMFTKKKDLNYYGEVLIGFGLLFLGLATMKHGFVPLKDCEAFQMAFVQFSGHPLLAVAAGAILTMIVQSSSATIGITIAVAATGRVDMQAACALVLGENIGTTITANLAAIGTNAAARRAAFGHFLINVFGVMYMLFFLHPFIEFIDYITPGAPDAANMARHIANFHTAFNIINLLICLPLLHLLAKACEKIIPGRRDGHEKFQYIDDMLIETPVFAVAQAAKEVNRMSDIAVDMLKLSKDAFLEKDTKKIRQIFDMEETVDLLEKDISNFLVKLYQKQLSTHTSNEVNNMLQVLHDLEKIGDYAENIAVYTDKAIESKMVFTDSAYTQIEEMFDVAIRFAENIIKEYHSGNFPRKVDTEDENKIDQLRKVLKSEHMSRLHEGLCNVETGILYVDILNNLEKTGDQVFNIAQIVMGDVR